MLDLIKRLLDDFDSHLEKAQTDESWQWAMNEMKSDINDSFCKALEQIKLIKQVIEDAKNNKSN